MPRCPECREPVSPFAAGCAICGADLEAARRRDAQRRHRRPRLPAVRLPGWASGVALPVAAVLLVVLASPLLGVIIAGLMLRSATLAADGPLRATLWCAVALGIALLLSPTTRYGVAWLLLLG